MIFLFHFKGGKLFAYPSIEFYSKDHIHFVLPLDKQQDFVFFKNQDADESSEEEVDESEIERRSSDGKSPSVGSAQLRKRAKEMRRNSSGSSFDELNMEENLEDENDKNV